MPAQLVRWIAAALVAATAVPASAQYYPRVEYTEAAVELLRTAAHGEREGGGTIIGTLATLQDKDLVPLFTAMANGADPAARVFGVLGVGMTDSNAGISPAMLACLKDPAEVMVVVREANSNGLLRATNLDPLMARTDLLPPTIVTLTGELNRRGQAWDAARIKPLVAFEEPSLAGVASLLMLTAGDSAPWEAFRTRCLALEEPERSQVARALAEASMVFELKKAAQPVLDLCLQPGMSDEAQFAAIGMALAMAPEDGMKAWLARVAARRTQPALVRAGLQLLASEEKNTPAGAFEKIRTGSPVLEAIANTGVALRSQADPVATLIALYDVGHPASAEWALVRARKLPPEKAAAVWKHVLAKIDAPQPEDRPTAVPVALAVRELMKTEPAAVKALLEKARAQPVLAVAILSGVYDSAAPEGAEIARALRGSLPRAGESLAAMILARTGAPMTDDDFDVLGRAAAGGGDLEVMRSSQAAWYLLKRRGKSGEAVTRIAGPGGTK